MIRVRRLNWIPPFAVGLSAAIAAEVAVGLLLYVTPGFLRALTLILAVLLSSLALGLWTAPHSDEALTERLRRRWLLVLFAFAGGSAVAGVWSVRGGLSESSTMQGIGLALLAALPLYSCGALLGGMSAPRLSHVRGPVGSSAAAGAALGTVLAGYVLAAVLHPVSIYAFCLVLLSGAAIVHGAVIAAEGERKRLGSVPSAYGQVRVEEWSWGKNRREKVLIENGRVRGLEVANGEPGRKWEKAALEILAGIAAPVPRVPAMPDSGETPPAVLILGGGALTLARLLEARGEVGVEVVERNPVVLDAARTHFAAPENGPRLIVRVEDPRSAVEGCPGRYVAIVVDSSALAPQDPLAFADASELDALRRCMTAEGLLLVGGIERDAAHGVPLDRLLSEAKRVFPTAALFVAERSKRAPVVSHAPSAELMLALSPDPDAVFPSLAGGLELEAVSRRQDPAPQPADVGELP